MMNILVIDDEKPTLSMFRLFLSAYGYSVHTAENGELGMELFHAIRPEIVFTDLKMPGMDGLQVLRSIRESGNDTQVIVITGHGDMEKALQALELDAADFINKPVERQALDEALTRAENRIRSGLDSPMKIVQCRDDNNFLITVHGRITGDSRADFDSAAEAIDPGVITTVILHFSDDFSINQDGISCLVGFLNRMKGIGATIVFEGLSLNFRRIFDMVGIYKSAHISPSDDLDLP